MGVRAIDPLEGDLYGALAVGGAVKLRLKDILLESNGISDDLVEQFHDELRIESEGASLGDSVSH